MKIAVSIILGLVVSFTSELILEGIQISIDQIVKTGTFFVFPLFGAIIITIIRKYYLGINKSFGLDEIQDELYHIEYKIMDMKDTVVKTILTFVTLVFGFSAGKFGPLIHIGGSIGSKFAYHFKLKEDDIRYFIATGVSAALASFFSNPLFGIFFSFEILLKYRVNYRVIYPIIGAYSTLLINKFIFNDIFFSIEHYENLLPMGTLISRIVIIGIFTGLFATFYKYLLKQSKDFLKRKEKWYFPLIAGVVISIVGYFYPENFNLYVNVNHMVINREILLHTAVILLALKLLTTTVTFAFGGLGGGFAPAIYLGMLIGYIFSQFLFLGDCGNILGMVGMMAAFSNAPIATTLLFTGIMGTYTMFIPYLILALISSFTNKAVVKVMNSMK